MEGLLLWWGYVHENGSLQVKRYFDMTDIADAKTSPFVQKVLPIIEAKNREEAIERLETLLRLEI